MTSSRPVASRTAFAASSFLDGANADYVDQLAARHAAAHGAHIIGQRRRPQRHPSRPPP